ncbi:hypothetical protein PORY_002183 [Pneumocystis oryctolagi]|uniref:Uncharacterized protein n=1 Tax=Pneumocystis oryctolagi TaxID=42067 RepID=A0ACB7CC05_9ASCO|nr:hypothetical protein PORY_002183 [Pneumocystis oryctolagi]
MGRDTRVPGFWLPGTPGCPATSRKTKERTTLRSDRSASGVLTSQKMSRDLRIEQYTLSFHGRVLIEVSEKLVFCCLDAQKRAEDGVAKVELNYGQRYGLLGANGSGKSTFLRSLAERDIAFPMHLDVFLVNEEAAAGEKSALDYILESARAKFLAVEEEFERLLTEKEESEKDSEEGLSDALMEELMERMNELEGEISEAKAVAVLRGLGFSDSRMKTPTKEMSGGWRMRVALGCALFLQPTVLLLDEPTNHLDLEAVVWLETYLSQYRRILVVNSHSQDFLNHVCTNIIDLTPSRQLVYYGGNYDVYVRTKHELEVNQMKAYAKQQDEITHIKKFISSAGTYANLVRQAKSKQKIIDKMEAAGLVEKVEQPKTVSFKFENVRKLPPPIISFNDVSFSYDGKSENTLYESLSFGIDMDSRIALLGKNGAGKSTLLNLIMGNLIPTTGNISKNSGLKLAKYCQHSADQLPYDKSPLDYIQDKFKALYPERDVQQWRSHLGRFGLSGAHQTNEIRMLSDGLKSRVVFAELALENPHIILLDEPTNHLDVASIDALAKACNSWTGGIVLISHDFRLIEQVCLPDVGELWEVKHKKIVKLDITIQQYKESLKAKSAASLEKTKLGTKKFE